MGDAATTIFPVDFTLGYINRDYVYVYLTGNAYNTELTYTWVSNSQIELTTPVASGVEFNIRRVVPRDTLVNAFEDGAVLRGKNLDESNLQHLMLEEEDQDIAVTTNARLQEIEDSTSGDTRYIHWLYREGSALGGEITISIPYTFTSVATVFINGVRMTYGIAFTYSVVASTVTFTEALTETDEVVVSLGTDPIQDYSDLVTDVQLAEIQNITKPYIFDNVSGMANSTIVFPVGKKLETKGYNIKGVGANSYLIKTSAQATTDGDVYSGTSVINIMLADGKVAISQAIKSITVSQCGGISYPTSTNEHPTIKKMFDELKDKKTEIEFNTNIRLDTSDSITDPIQIHNNVVRFTNEAYLLVNNDKVPTFWAVDKVITWHDFYVIYDGNLSTEFNSVPAYAFINDVLGVLYPGIPAGGPNGYQAQHRLFGCNTTLHNPKYEAHDGATADQYIMRAVTQKPSTLNLGEFTAYNPYFDGVIMGFLVGSGSKLFKMRNLISKRYSVLPTSISGAGMWAPPPHLFYTSGVGGVEYIDVDGIIDYGIDGGGGNNGQTSIKPVSVGGGFITNVTSFRNHGLIDFSCKNTKITKMFWKGNSDISSDGPNGVNPVRQTEPPEEFGAQDNNEIDVTLIDTSAAPYTLAFQDASGSNSTIPSNSVYKIKTVHQQWPTSGGPFYDPIRMQNCKVYLDITLNLQFGTGQANLFNSNTGLGGNSIFIKAKGFKESTFRVLSNNDSQATIENLDKGTSIFMAGRQYVERGISTLEVTANTSNTLTFPNAIPAGSIVKSVGAKVNINFGTSNGLTGFMTGVTGDLDKYGIRNGSGGATDNVDWTDTSINMQTSTQSLLITSVGGNFDGVGQIDISVGFESMNLQTEVT